MPANTRRHGQRIGIALAVLLMSGGLEAAEVRTDAGVVSGTTSADGDVRIFKGIPYAAPPVGSRRWQAPQPPAHWEGVKKAEAFGPRCVQGRIFGDMIFRDEMGEDCLYLNVWSPSSATANSRLPVMVWIYGGGFQAGSASEPRQDGEQLARKGVVVVSFNYRLGVFGFLAHPELTKESPHGASGNYALMDMAAALRWVKANVAQFGGDPGNVTIFGESAGSFAVSALLASPLTKGLVHKAIGESGAFFSGRQGTLATPTLADAEAIGTKLAETLGAASLADMRAKSADEVLKAASGGGPGLRYAPIVDGYALPRSVADVYRDGQQAQVPLLAGWNEDEVRSGIVLGREPVTAAGFAEQNRKRFGEKADGLLKVYPAASDEEAVESAASLAGDLFIGYGTWKWLEVHAATSDKPVYRFSFDRDIPIPPDTMVNGKAATSKDIGARHAGEIEYVFGQLESVPKVTWEPADRKLSDLMMSYWTNFAKTGDPNGKGLPEWPRYDTAGHPVMHLNVESKAAPDARRERYLYLDSMMQPAGSQEGRTAVRPCVRRTAGPVCGAGL